MTHNTLVSYCVCTKTQHKFIPKLIFNKTIPFHHYQGTIIGMCPNCGLYKTILPPKNFKPTASRSTMYEQNKTNLIKEFNPIIQTITSNPLIHTVLDVGCSSGILIDELIKFGIDAWGIEPNIEAFNQARKKHLPNLFKGTLTTFLKKFPGKQFDCILYNHVFEHIENPNKELESICKVLKPHGTLIIGVPNRRNIVFSLRGALWESLMPSEHVWHFTNHYLNQFLENNGFTTKHTYYANHTRATLPLLKRIYFGLLNSINTLLKTGEAVTIVCQMR